MMLVILVGFGYLDTGSQNWGHTPLPPWVLEDTLDGLTQMGNSTWLQVSFCLAILSTAALHLAAKNGFTLLHCT